MRDDERRAILQQLVQSFLNQRFGSSVHRARRLIENQNLGIECERPGKGEQLPLPL